MNKIICVFGVLLVSLLGGVSASASTSVVGRVLGEVVHVEIGAFTEDPVTHQAWATFKLELAGQGSAPLQVSFQMRDELAKRCAYSEYQNSNCFLMLIYVPIVQADGTSSIATDLSFYESDR